MKVIFFTGSIRFKNLHSEITFLWLSCIMLSTTVLNCFYVLGEHCLVFACCSLTMDMKKILHMEKSHLLARAIMCHRLNGISGRIELASRLHKCHCTFGTAEDKNICYIVLEVFQVPADIKAFLFVT